MNAAVTSWALATPLGDAVEAVAARLWAGERAARAHPHFSSGSYGVPAVAAIASAPPRTPHDRVLRRIGRFGWAVGRAALASAPVPSGTRLGLFSALGGLRAHWNELLPALRDQEDDLSGSWARGLRLLHPFWMLQHLSNNTHALLSRDVDARGEGATFGGASAGAQALEAAILALHEGAIDAALVVAHDTLIEPETLVDLAARGATSGAAPAAVAAPYGARAGGFVPGEAAAALLLERPDRDAALAWIAAASCADGQSGVPAAATLGDLARRLARRDPVVDGAALACLAGDAAERAAVARTLPDAQLTAVQAASGQLGAAAPLVQAIALAACLREGRLPPIAALAAPAAGPLRPVTCALPTTARSALCLSGGSPGLAAAVRVSLDKTMEESR